jgi:hypothetical protein
MLLWWLAPNPLVVELVAAERQGFRSKAAGVDG